MEDSEANQANSVLHEVHTLCPVPDTLHMVVHMVFNVAR